MSSVIHSEALSKLSKEKLRNIQPLQNLTKSITTDYIRFMARNEKKGAKIFHAEVLDVDERSSNVSLKIIGMEKQEYPF